MRYFWWLVRIAVFLLILGFAVKNTDLVTVRYYLGQEWRAPLVFVLLLFFGAGIGVGILAGLGYIYRQRRELTSLRRELRARDPAAGRDA